MLHKLGRVDTLLICVDVCLYVSAIVIQLLQLAIWQMTCNSIVRCMMRVRQKEKLVQIPQSACQIGII
jgi:hypothetical protein